MSTAEHQGWIAVDLDGTLAYYDGWKGELYIGEPIQPMVQRVKQWIEDGADVRIFTARTNPDQYNQVSRAVEVRGAIKAWCLQHIGVELEVTYMKDFEMTHLFDDRCVHVKKNTGLLTPLIEKED